MQKTSYIIFLLLTLLLSACNKDGVIVDEGYGKPVITLDSETGVYTVKTGHSLTISPRVSNAIGATYLWTIDSEVVGRERELTVTYDKAQELYATFQVVTDYGHAEEEIKIEVVEAAAPVISLPVPADGIKVLADTDYKFEPDFLYDDDTFGCEWLLNGVRVGEGKTYTFHQKETGKYTVTIVATNDDGTTRREVAVEVVEQMPCKLYFDTPSYYQTGTDRSAVAGRPIYLRPLMENIGNASFEWSIDGTVVSGAGERTLKFTPAAAGDYKVTVKASSADGAVSATADVCVHCYATEGTQRMATAASSYTQSKVYEFLPAPGQFVNDISYAGYTGSETTHAAAVAYAEKRLADRSFISLGAFGGYIIMGFDHSIACSGGYDFAILGNAFNGSSEPGIVWVMQDTNGNGLPDDEWYELSGSETGKSGTLQDYEVTYYRPANGSNVHWTDSEGNSGTVDYLGMYHNQPSYYPAWMAADSYTLRGTRLSPNNVMDASGNWTNNSYEWGYVDNYGTDMTGSSEDGASNPNRFKISNAIHRDGTPVSLKFIDFVKVQVALNTKSGMLGENSTEVYGAEILK